MVSMPRCGCHGKPARYSSGRSLRKSSSSRKGSNSRVSPKPKARRSLTPAPSIVGLDCTMLLTGRTDMVLTSLRRQLGGRHEFRGESGELVDEGLQEIARAFVGHGVIGV